MMPTYLHRHASLFAGSICDKISIAIIEQRLSLLIIHRIAGYRTNLVHSEKQMSQPSDVSVYGLYKPINQPLSAAETSRAMGRMMSNEQVTATVDKYVQESIMQERDGITITINLAKLRKDVAKLTSGRSSLGCINFFNAYINIKTA